MICYIDTSVVLRSIFGHREQFQNWKEIKKGLSSELLTVECHRVIDRYRLQGELDDKQVSEIKVSLTAFLRGLTLYQITGKILERASLPFPTVIGTLDAIHLSTALRWKEKHKEELHILSFDEQLRIAAQAMGLKVLPEVKASD